MFISTLSIHHKQKLLRKLKKKVKRKSKIIFYERLKLEF